MSIIETIIDIPAEHERKVCGQFDSYLKKIERIFNKNKAINFDIQKKEVILHSNFNG